MTYRIKDHSLQILWLITLTMLCNSCNDDLIFQDRDIQSNRMAIHAVLRNDRPVVISVSSAVPFLDSESIDYRVTNAEVRLYQDDLLIQTIVEQELDSALPRDSPNNASYYISANNISLTDGAEYRIEVEAPGYLTARSESIQFKKLIGERKYASFQMIYDSGQLYSVDTVEFELLTSASGEITLDAFIWYEDTSALADVSSIFSNPFRLSTARRVYGVNLPVGSYSESRPPGLIPSDFIRFDTVAYCGYITHRTPHYFAYAEPYTAQDREEIANPNNTGQPLPNNFTDGFGYFTVIDSEFVCSQ